MESILKDDKPKYKYNVSIVYPNNERVRKMQEEMLKKQAEQEKINQLELAKQREHELMNEEIKKQNEEARRRHLEEQRNMELDVRKALKNIEKGEGNMNEILKQIYRNTSPNEINFSGLELNDWDFHGLMVILPENMSLLTLNLSRKNLNDEKAKSLCEVLKVNKKLRRLELEGNFFGPEACTYFAGALRKNKTLKYLDLENNFLTENGTNIDGITNLCESLTENTTLISLNLAGNGLDDLCAQKIIAMLRKNHSLIHLEMFSNHYFVKKDNNNNIMNDSKFQTIGASVEHLEEIKKKISENREKDAKWRLKEWKERKQMKDEETEMRNLNNDLSKEKQAVVSAIEEKNKILDVYKSKFDNLMKEAEEKFQKDVENFYIETRQRLDKKGKGGKGKSKPKKK